MGASHRTFHHRKSQTTWKAAILGQVQQVRRRVFTQ